MDTSIPSLLLVMWLKSVLDWLVVGVQRHYMVRSFSGFFCISLALIDSILCFFLTAVFHLEDFTISGWRVTRYHICLLAQIVCFIYSILHWPVFLLTGLDNFWTLSPNSTHTSSKQKLTYIAGVCLVWILAALYVFWTPHVVVFLGDDGKRRCEMFSSPQTSQVVVALLLMIACVTLYSYTPLEKWRVQVFPHSSDQCLVCLRRVFQTFLGTWASFLVLLTVTPLLQVDMHAHLQLNVVWLCFLHSFTVALTLCGRSFTSNYKKSDTFNDGFCSWYFCFTYEAGEWNYGQKTGDHSQVKTLDI